MAAKEQHLAELVCNSPSDPKVYRDMCSYYLNEGNEERATAYILKAFGNLEGLLLPEKFHKPVMKAMLDLGYIHTIEMLVCDLERRYDVEDDVTIKRLVRKGRREINKAMKVFPDSIDGDLWWSEGPRTLATTALDEWLPGRIVKENDDTVTITAFGHNENNCLTDQTLEILPENINRTAKDSSYVEIGIYEDGSIHINTYKE